MCYPLELRHHTRRFTGHDQSCFLPSAAIKLEISRHRADGAHELFSALPTVGLRDDAAVVADHIHRDEARTAGAVKMFAEARVGTFCLLVLVGADETIKNLPDSQRQIVFVLFKHAAHLIEQPVGLVRADISNAWWHVEMHKATRIVVEAYTGYYW